MGRKGKRGHQRLTLDHNHSRLIEKCVPEQKMNRVFERRLREAVTRRLSLEDESRGLRDSLRHPTFH